MSALGDVAAAILPPEAGGPDPERVASVARRMISRMPRPPRPAWARRWSASEALSLARTGRTLGAASAAAARGAADAASPGLGGAPALDAVKSIVMLAHGADTFAAEIAAVGSRHEPSRPDPQLAIVARGRVAGELRAATRS